MVLSENELIEVTGGGVSASLLNALSRAITTSLSLGQIIGSAIRRVFSKKYC